MDIQKIKELALANGFKLKEQASGNMDLNAYVYDFANAIEQAAKAQVSEGFVLVPKKPDVDKAWSIALKRIVPPPKTNDAIQKELMCKKYVDDLYSEQDRILLDYEAMIEAQEPTND